MAAQHTFIPTPYEMVKYFLVGAIILGIFTLEPIIKNTNGASYTYLSDTVGKWFMTNIDKLNTPRVTAILTYALWAFVGALVYLMVWAITSLFKSVQEDVSPFHNLIAPQGYQPDKDMITRITRSLVRFMAVIGFFVAVGIFFSKVLPLSVSQFVTALTNIDLLSIVAIFLAVTYVAASLFVFAICFRLMLLRRRVFSDN